MRFHDSVTISAPIEVVYECWAALERSPEHQRPTIERRKLKHGAVRVGTRYRAIDQWPGRKVSFEMEITEYDRPYPLAATWEEPMEGAWLATFKAHGDATTMTLETAIDPTGLMGVREPLLRPWARKTLAAGLASFGSWVESGKR